MKIKVIAAPVILLFLVLTVLSIHVISSGAFGDVSLFVYFLSLFYFLLFSISFYLTSLYFSIRLPVRQSIKVLIFVPSNLTRIIFFLFLLSFILLYYLTIGFEFYSLQEARSNLIGVYRTSESGFEFKILNTTGVFVFFYASILYLTDNKYNSIYAFSAFSFPLLMMNRNFILIFLIFVIYKKLYIKKEIKSLLIIFLAFFAINIFYVYAFDKGGEGQNIIYSTIESLMSYVATPLYGLAYNINYPSNYGDLLTLPSAVVEWFGYNVNRDFSYTPLPHQTNVFTLFYSLIYDFGVMGVAGFALLIGLFHAYLYVKAKNNYLFLFLYLYSMYPLLMTFFDNVYTTSFGIWFYLLLPFIFFKRQWIRM
jgi:oligosaccharide repeat unit polymerase